MITLSNGKILLNGLECNNPELIYFTLKDMAEKGDYEFATSYLCEKVGQVL